MPEGEWVHVPAEESALVNRFSCAAVDAEHAKKIIKPVGRPLLAVLVEYMCVRHDEEEQIMLLTPWQGVAALAGQLDAWLSILPVDQRDQAAAMRRDYRAIALRGLDKIEDPAWCDGVRLSELGPDGRYVKGKCGSTSSHGGHWTDGRDE